MRGSRERRTTQKTMGNLNLTDNEIAYMEHCPSIQAIRIGRTEPYHLTYAKLYQGDEILNPHLPGNRLMADLEGREYDKRRGNEEK